MKKRFTAITAIILCLTMIFTFASCSGTTDDEVTDEFVAATIDITGSIPVSESEIIAFYNDIITKVQLAETFTAENKPGVKTSESLNVDNINILSYDAATGEASENDALAALNKSSKALKDRILGGIDTSVPVIAFGDMNASIDSVIFPYDNTQVTLTEADVVKAESFADGNNLNISIVLNNTVETVENVFGTRDKAEILAMMNEECKNYAQLSDYSVDYVYDEENNAYSTINLSVELEQQADGTYKCTGRITSFNIRILADIAAVATCTGSFASYGDIQINFRLTDEKNYEFDWLGSAEWEPVAEVASE